MKNLTASMKHYIKVIYELSSGGKGARISDIAAKLEVTKASSCIAMKALQKKNMVYRGSNRLVFLTKDGEYQAILTLDKVAIIRKFLTDVLGIKHEIADIGACAMEHAISFETLASLCRYTNREHTGRGYVKTDAVLKRIKNSM